jgi:hypothetical protein
MIPALSPPVVAWRRNTVTRRLVSAQRSQGLVQMRILDLPACIFTHAAGSAAAKQAAQGIMSGLDDTLNARGGADIEAGAAYARDFTAPLQPGSGYSKCGCK